MKRDVRQRNKNQGSRASAYSLNESWCSDLLRKVLVGRQKKQFLLPNYNKSNAILRYDYFFCPRCDQTELKRAAFFSFWEGKWNGGACSCHALFTSYSFFSHILASFLSSFSSQCFFTYWVAFNALKQPKSWWPNIFLHSNLSILASSCACMDEGLNGGGFLFLVLFVGNLTLRF